VHWETINPNDFNDGIYYLPAGLELQPRQPDWGHPDQPDLRDRIANDRPHGIGGAKLLCLLCMRLRTRGDAPRQPEWMTLVESQHGPVFRHESGRSPHAEHTPETDAHKALKERKANTWEASGASSVEVEEWRPRARRRPDVLAVGPNLIVAGEVQHSKERPRIIQARQRSLAKTGDRVVWTTDHNADDIAFLHAVPHLAIRDLNDHRLYLRQDRLEINAGAITFEEQRCGWTDLWNRNTTRCPATHKTIPCGRMHLYPTLNPNTYIRRGADTDARFPCGNRLHLDHMLEGILHGQWLPYPNRSRIVWIPANVHDDVVAERGGSVEQAESGTVRRRDEAAERACERRVGLIPAQREAPAIEQTATCCGGRTGRPGEPLLPACLLCPQSPTYWRNAPARSEEG
jgi:hypothetical protein